MFDWLFEGRIGVYVVLAALALVLLLAWRSLRRRWLLVAAGVAAGLMVVYLLLSFVETERKADRKQIRSRLEEMAAAAEKGDREGLMKYVSDKFRTPQGTDKAMLRERLNQSGGGVGPIQLDSFDFGDGPRRSQGTATVNFRAWSGKTSFRCEVIFDYDAREGWRVRSFRIFGPLPYE